MFHTGAAIQRAPGGIVDRKVTTSYVSRERPDGRVFGGCEAIEHHVRCITIRI
jgi:hypothetical protein